MNFGPAHFRRKEGADPLRWLGVLLLFILAIAVARRGLPHVSADNLYGYCFLRDLLDPAVPMAWSLPHSPYFFPDLLLVLPGALLGAGVAVTYHIAFALHLALLWGSMAFVSRVLTPRAPRASHANAATLAVGLYLASVLLYRTFTASPVYFPTMHANALPLGLGLLGLSIGVVYGESYRTPTLLFLLLATLAFFSDEIVLAQFGLPLLGAAILYALCGQVSWRRAGVLAGAILFSALFGRGLYALLDRWPEVMLKRPYVGLRLDSVATLIRALLQQSPELLRDGAVALLAAAAWILGLAGICLRRRRGSQRLLTPPQAWGYGVLLLVVPCTLTATLGGLLVAEHAAIPQRYLLPTFFVPFAGLALIQHLDAALRGLRRASKAFFLAAALAGLGVTLWQPGSWTTPYPPWLREIDAIAHRHGLRRGFASYNRTKPLTVLSRASLNAAPLRGGLPYVWIDNSFNFLERTSGPPRLTPLDFILTTGFEPRRLRAIYGRPAIIETTRGGEQIWIYDAAAGRPMNMSHFLGSFLRAVRDYGYPVNFLVPPAFLRLEGEDLGRPAAKEDLPPALAGGGAAAIPPGASLATPWQRLPGGTQEASARIASTAPVRVTFRTDPPATVPGLRMQWKGTAPGATNLHLCIPTEGLTDIRLVLENDGPGSLFVDTVQLTGHRIDDP